MTDQPNVPPQANALDEDAVVAYLRAHPSFFAEHDELLLEQHIPTSAATACRWWSANSSYCATATSRCAIACRN